MKKTALILAGVLTSFSMMSVANARCPSMVGCDTYRSTCGSTCASTAGVTYEKLGYTTRDLNGHYATHWTKVPTCAAEHIKGEIMSNAAYDNTRTHSFALFPEYY